MTKRIFAAMCTLMLVMQLIPATAFAQRTDIGESRVSIEQLLAAGEYAEGEAIAIVKASSGQQDQSRTLADISSEAVEQAVVDASGSNYAATEEVAGRVTSAGDDSFRVELIRDSSRTTEQILRDLYADPNVIAAEPNYIGYNTAALSETSSTSASTSASTTASDTVDSPDSSAPLTAASEDQLATSNTPSDSSSTELSAMADTQAIDAGGVPGDLTPLQWYTDDSQSTFTSPKSPTAGYSLNIPGWAEGRTNSDAPDNAGGTVCLMDTGLDDAHPDLQGVLYHFSEEQQKKYNCGEYGVNACGDLLPRSTTKASDSHGSHVAGIVAAQWNEFGISGVAKGAKLFEVRVFGEEDSQVESAVIDGFKFLIDVAKETNLKAVNCSWGLPQPCFAYSAMVNELGRKGVTCVIASGNRALDLDADMEFAAMPANSPYTVSINAALMDGTLTEFSCWGQASTDVFSPGTEIMSTVPVMMESGEGENITSRRDGRRFFPEASDTTSLVSNPGMERFDGATSDVLFFDSNPVTNADAKSIGTASDEAGYDDNHSMAISISNLSGKEERSLNRGYSCLNGSFYVAIPVANVADARWLALDFATSDSYRAHAGIVSLVYENESGNAVEIDNAYPVVVKSGVQTGAFSNTYQSQWTNVSYNIAGYQNAANEARKNRKQADDGTWYIPGSSSQAGQFRYPDPGEVTGLYKWSHDGKGYVVAKVGIGAKAGVSPAATDSTKLYVDNVSVGGANSCVGANMVMAGTSMATPAATGCVAIVAKDEPANATLTDNQLEQLARERKAKLLAAVDYDEENLGKLCRTGGRLNLHGQSTFEKKAPLITRAEAVGETLAINGFFFGEGGVLEIDGEEVEVDSWMDGQILATVSGLSNGSHIARVTNPDGAMMQCPFSYSSDSAVGRPLYERSHSLPVSLPSYTADDSDRLHGSLVECGGSLYAMTATLKDNHPQALWRYNIANDAWSRCADIPKDITGENHKAGKATYSSIVSLNGKIYVRDLSQADYSVRLWAYDPDADSWSMSDYALPSSAAFFTLQGKLFIIGNNFSLNTQKEREDSEDGPANLSAQAEEDEAKQEETACFGILDLNSGSITKVEGTIPTTVSASTGIIATSADKVYAYMPAETGDADSGIVDPNAEKPTPKFMRFTYDASKNEMTSEDLTSVLMSANPRYLAPVGNEDGIHLALAGLSDGVALIGSKTLGEDTHIIKNSSTDVEPYERTSSYHYVFEPLAAYSDGSLYVAGFNAAEPDVMYLRSTDYDEAQQAMPKTGDGGQTATLSQNAARTVVKTGDFAWYAIAFALLVIVIAGGIALSVRMRRNRQ